MCFGLQENFTGLRNDLFLQEKKLSNTVCLTLGPNNFRNSIGASTNLDGTNLNEPENIQMYKAYKETITNC
jgi:hypothetical protein